MAKNYINFEKIERLTEQDKDVPIAYRAIKLSEETGEFSQAVLRLLGSKNVSASAGNLKEDVLEELCDVLNVTVDLINILGFSDEEVQEMFEKKLNKWEAKQKKYKEG